MAGSFKIKWILLLILVPSCLFAQRSGNTRFYPYSYILELPNSWHKPKMMRLVTDIIPATLEELRDRSFRTEGKADYYVRLFIDSLEVWNEHTSSPVEKRNGSQYSFSYNFSFNYRFYAALMVYDSFQRPVTALRLVSSKEEFVFNKSFSSLGQGGVYERQLTYDTLGKVNGSYIRELAKPLPPELPSFDPFTYLTEETILQICSDKLREISKFLANAGR